jgi:FkbM family methyltransferase
MSVNTMLTKTIGRSRAGPALLLIVLCLLPLGCYREPNWLVKKYGRQLYSSGNEELIIRDFFKDKKAGFFVDVGANHYRIGSTTYFLEDRLGWHGIAIDAICDFEADYLEYRKNTRFFCFYVGDKSNGTVDFYITQKNYKRRSSADVGWSTKYSTAEKTQVPTITLNDLLERAGVAEFDFLSMDIELAEPAALAGFDIEKYHPALVCIELHKEVRQAILDYFTKHGYAILEKYRRLDPADAYLAPLR